MVNSNRRIERKNKPKPGNAQFLPHIQIPKADENINMGAFLDKPKTEKFNSCGSAVEIQYAVAAMQGWRVDMEDAHSEICSMGTGVFKDWAFFAVFDGHAGMKVAQHASQNLLDSVLIAPQLKEAKALLEKNNAKITPEIISLLEKGLRQGFLTLDERMHSNPEIFGENERSGTTAICAVVAPSHIFVSNLGDSRAVLSRDGKWYFGTEDHKPYMPKERDRIVKAGGSVMIQRVNGSLAVSRALGDFEYKATPGLPPIQQLVSPEPDIYAIERDIKCDEFLLLACDGVYDVMSNEELCDFVRSRLTVTSDLQAIGNQILDTCLSKGSRDNMSVIILTFCGAPTVSNTAQQAEQQLIKLVQQRVHGILKLSDNVADVETDYVLRILSNQEIPGLLPNTGIHAIRNTVSDIVAKLKTEMTNESPDSKNKTYADPKS